MSAGVDPDDVDCRFAHVSKPHRGGVCIGEATQAHKGLQWVEEAQQDSAQMSESHF